MDRMLLASPSTGRRPLARPAARQGSPALRTSLAVVAIGLAVGTIVDDRTPAKVGLAVQGVVAHTIDSGARAIGLESYARSLQRVF